MHETGGVQAAACFDFERVPLAHKGKKDICVAQKHIKDGAC